MPTGIYERTEKHNKNTSKAMMGREPWNKNLTKETDKRLANVGKKISKKLKGKPNFKIHGAKNGMSKLNPESEKRRKDMGKKVSKTVIKLWKNEEFRKRNLEARIGKKRSKQFKRDCRVRKLERLKDLKGQRAPFYNIEACQFFNILNKKYNLKGLHAENKGEFQVQTLGYFLDYYEPCYNIVIEWNEKAHYKNNKLTELHKQRQHEIKSYLKCHFINIRQKTFKKENIFKKIEKIINYSEIKEVP